MEHIVKLSNPTREEVDRAIEETLIFKDKNHLYREKICLTFSDEVEIPWKLVRKPIRGKELYLRFFMVCRPEGSTAPAEYAYTRNENGRRGYRTSIVPNSVWSKLVSVSVKGKDYGAISHRIAHGIYPGAWADLKEKLLKDDGTYVKDHYPSDCTPFSIKSKFPTQVIEALKRAFDEKSDYRYRYYGDKRTLSVQTKMCEDGIFRAWFSSEYAGCANGKYYILIRPSTAVFGECD